jgi:hypothetical protein
MEVMQTAEYAVTAVEYHGPTDGRGSRYSFVVRGGDLSWLGDAGVRTFAKAVGGNVRKRGDELRVWVPYPYEGFRNMLETAIPDVGILIERESAWVK